MIENSVSLQDAWLAERNRAEKSEARVAELEVLVYDLASRPCLSACTPDLPCTTCRAQKLMGPSVDRPNEAQPKKYALTCDGCGALSPIVSEESEVVDAATDAGWTSVGHNEDDRDACPSCQLVPPNACHLAGFHIWACSECGMEMPRSAAENASIGAHLESVSERLHRVLRRGASPTVFDEGDHRPKEVEPQEKFDARVTGIVEDGAKRLEGIIARDAAQQSGSSSEHVEWARAFLWRVLGQRPPTAHVGELARELVRRGQGANRRAAKDGAR